jgi:hypothetical protein
MDEMKGVDLSPRLANVLIAVITFVWCINFTVPIFNHEYKPPPEIHLALMAIVGLFAAARQSNSKDKEDDKK